MMNFTDGNGHHGHIYDDSFGGQMDQAWDDIWGRMGSMGTGIISSIFFGAISIAWFCVKMGIKIAFVLVKWAFKIIFHLIGYIMNLLIERHVYEHSTGNVNVNNWNQEEENRQDNSAPSNSNHSYYTNGNSDNSNDNFDKYMK